MSVPVSRSRFSGHGGDGRIVAGRAFTAIRFCWRWSRIEIDRANRRRSFIGITPGRGGRLRSIREFEREIGRGKLRCGFGRGVCSACVAGTVLTVTKCRWRWGRIEIDRANFRHSRIACAASLDSVTPGRGGRGGLGGETEGGGGG